MRRSASSSRSTAPWAPPQWSDVGGFIQNIMLLARAHGLHTCPQEAWTYWHKTLIAFLELPPEHILFCGIALGYADEDAPINRWRAEREPVDAFATSRGFEAEAALVDTRRALERFDGCNDCRGLYAACAHFCSDLASRWRRRPGSPSAAERKLPHARGAPRRDRGAQGGAARPCHARRQGQDRRRGGQGPALPRGEGPRLCADSARAGWQSDAGTTSTRPTAMASTGAEGRTLASPRRSRTIPTSTASSRPR